MTMKSKFIQLESCISSSRLYHGWVWSLDSRLYANLDFRGLKAWPQVKRVLLAWRGPWWVAVIAALSWTLVGCLVVFVCWHGYCNILLYLLEHALWQGYWDLLIYRTIAGIGLGWWIRYCMAFSSRAEAGRYNTVQRQQAMLPSVAKLGVLTALLTPYYFLILFGVVSGWYYSCLWFDLPKWNYEPEIFVQNKVRNAKDIPYWTIQAIVKDGTTKTSIGVAILTSVQTLVTTVLI